MSSERASEAQFRGLRAVTHQQMCTALANRILSRPEPTAFEESAGTHLECIEPQVVLAVVALRNAGWNTTCSGFGARECRIQDIQFCGGVLLNDSVVEEIEDAGATIRSELYPHQVSYWLEFEPEEADIDKITDQWNRIAACIPVIGRPFVSQRNSFTDRAFVLNALAIGMRPEQLISSPFATRTAIFDAVKR